MLRLTQARSLVVVCSAGALRVIVDLGLDNKALTDKKKGADSEKMGGNNLFLIARNEFHMRERESGRATRKRRKLAVHEV